RQTSSPFKGLDGMIYGLTYDGSRACFRVSRDGGSFEILRRFPELLSGATGLIQGSDRALYGFGVQSSTAGTLFRLRSDGSVFQTIATIPPPGLQGREVFSLVEGPDGALYGTTVRGGDLDLGVLFRITPPPDITQLQLADSGARLTLGALSG